VKRRRNFQVRERNWLAGDQKKRKRDETTEGFEKNIMLAGVKKKDGNGGAGRKKPGPWSSQVKKPGGHGGRGLKVPSGQKKVGEGLSF